MSGDETNVEARGMRQAENGTAGQDRTGELKTEGWDEGAGRRKRAGRNTRG